MYYLLGEYQKAKEIIKNTEEKLRDMVTFFYNGVPKQHNYMFESLEYGVEKCTLKLNYFIGNEKEITSYEVPTWIIDKYFAGQPMEAKTDYMIFLENEEKRNSIILKKWLNEQNSLMTNIALMESVEKAQREKDLEELKIKYGG